MTNEPARIKSTGKVCDKFLPVVMGDEDADKKVRFRLNDCPRAGA